MNLKELITDVKRRVDKFIVWTDDQFAFDKPEYWTSWAWKIEELENAGKYEVIKDDCDGFALTSAALLIKAGFPAAQVNVAFCEIVGAGYHMVCIANDGQNDWVMCNNQVRPILKSLCDYKWISHMNYGAVGTWVKDT